MTSTSADTLPAIRTKIVATVGPASREPVVLRKLIDAGVNVFRLNFSHGSHEEHSAILADIRRIGREVDRQIAILQDLSGPKIRLGPIPGDLVECHLGEEFTLVTDRTTEDPHELTCSYPNLPNDLKPGETVMLSYRRSLRHAALTLSIALLVLLLGGCIGPPVLERQVLGYDQVAKTLNEKLLLINIARVHNDETVHFTSTSSIAATFDWTTTVGAGGQVNEAPHANFLDLNVGVSASENPTFSIVPIAGEEFTKRIVTPFDDRIFEFVVFQGVRIEQVMRLMAGGIEVQTEDGRFVRFIENDTRNPEEYKEFRRIAMFLQALNETRRLFVRTLVFEDTLIADFKAVPRAEDINNGFDKGLRWRQKPDGHYELTRLEAGRVVVLDFDPLALSDRERFELNEQIKKNPAGFVHLELRHFEPGRHFQGAIKLRSMMQILVFLARTINLDAGVDVAPDPELGAGAPSPPAILKINVTDSAPDDNVPSIPYRGRYYSVNDTPWDRTSFVLLNILFQTAIGEIQGVGIPITISK